MKKNRMIAAFIAAISCAGALPTVPLSGNAARSVLVQPAENEPPTEEMPETVHTERFRVIDIINGMLLVRPSDRRGEELTLPAARLGTDVQPVVGMIIEITYSGGFLETYPAMFSDIKEVSVISDCGLDDFMDMTADEVRELYDSTGLTEDKGYTVWTEETAKNYEGSFLFFTLRPEPMYRTENGVEVINETNSLDGLDMLTNDTGDMEQMEKYIKLLNIPEDKANVTWSNPEIRTEGSDETGIIYRKYLLYRISPDRTSGDMKSFAAVLNYIQWMPFFDSFHEAGEPSKAELKGDANCNGTVEMSDAVLVMQTLANPSKYGENGTSDSRITEKGRLNADMDGDGLTAGDALSIQKKLLGITDGPTASSGKPSEENMDEQIFKEWNGKKVYTNLYDRLMEDSEEAIPIIYQLSSTPDKSFLYNGKTLEEYGRERLDQNFEKYEQLLIHGEDLKYGETVYTAGTPDGRKWVKGFYDETVEFIGEELLSKYIVSGVFRKAKLEADLKAMKEERINAYNQAEKAYFAYIADETVKQLEEQDITYKYETSPDRLVIYASSEQFAPLELEYVTLYGLDYPVSDGLTIGTVF